MPGIQPVRNQGQKPALPYILGSAGLSLASVCLTAGEEAVKFQYEQRLPELSFTTRNYRLGERIKNT